MRAAAAAVAAETAATAAQAEQGSDVADLEDRVFKDKQEQQKHANHPDLQLSKAIKAQVRRKKIIDSADLFFVRRKLIHLWKIAYPQPQVRITSLPCL